MRTILPWHVLLPCCSVLMLAACASPAPRAPRSIDAPAAELRDVRCGECGTIERIQPIGGTRRDREGAVLGGVVGGALGVDPDQAPAASRAEADAPAVAGYEIFVRMDDGRRLIVEQRELHGVHDGAYVEVRRGRVFVRD